MSRATKILALLAAVFIVLTLIIWFSFLSNSNNDSVVLPEAGAPVVDTSVPVAVKPGRAKMAVEIVKEEERREKSSPIAVNLVKISSAFTERLGSYSNQEVSYDNVRDLQIFMTDSMKNWSENFIKDSMLKSGDSSIYYGITTKALSAKLDFFDENKGSAEIIVKTQRRESIGDTLNTKVYYQDMKIVMKKGNGDTWKVDGAYWQ